MKRSGNLKPKLTLDGEMFKKSWVSTGQSPRGKRPEFCCLVDEGIDFVVFIVNSSLLGQCYIRNNNSLCFHRRLAYFGHAAVDLVSVDAVLGR